MLEANIEDLELKDGNLEVRGAPEKRRTISQLFQAHYGAAVGSMAGSYDNRDAGWSQIREQERERHSAFSFLSACACRRWKWTPRRGEGERSQQVVSAVDAGKRRSILEQCRYAERRIDDHVVGVGAV